MRPSAALRQALQRSDGRLHLILQLRAIPRSWPGQMNPDQRRIVISTYLAEVQLFPVWARDRGEVIH